MATLDVQCKVCLKTNVSQKNQTFLIKFVSSNIISSDENCHTNWLQFKKLHVAQSYLIKWFMYKTSSVTSSSCLWSGNSQVNQIMQIVWEIWVTIDNDLVHTWTRRIKATLPLYHQSNFGSYFQYCLQGYTYAHIMCTL